MIKKISLIVNIVLIVAVGILYYLHFSDKTKESKEKPKKYFPLTSKSAGSLQFVYINIDTLLNGYDYFYVLKKKFETRQKQLEAELGNKSKAFEAEVADLQEKMQKGLILRSKAQEKEQELLREQQNLLLLRDKLTMQLSEEEQVMNRQMMQKIMDYVKEYSENQNYQFIFSTTYGGNLLYAPENYNITKQIITGLNARYAEETDD